MSATVIGEKRRTTLPVDVFEAAGLKLFDQVDWRFEEGEIRGRKIKPAGEPRAIVAKLVKRGDALVFEAPGVSIAPADIAKAVREERDSR